MTPGVTALAQQALSNRQRDQQRRSRPKSGRTPTPANTDNVRPIRKREQDPNRDFLSELYRRGTIRKDEYTAGLVYRNAYSCTMAEGVPLKSCIASMGMAGGSSSPVGQPRIVSDISARLDLIWLREAVLGGQEDAVKIMDAVCGMNKTTAELAGGNDRKAGTFNAILKVALGQCSNALVKRASGKVERVG